MSTDGWEFWLAAAKGAWACLRLLWVVATLPARPMPTDYGACILAELEP